ncbi:ribonuclease-3 [Inhella inkyongensis]|uniref:Ribonuclease 3 n=1 Tax=Inhella inkyongensis TaxID=392593 RepID=A0A840S7G5_9BURK|nr:ribonuclease III [Inhella inkyongensis]MBB5204389.1 ribonuclease-3 [Inhella inkyongensis]
MATDNTDLQAALGYRFRDARLLQRALTHRSHSAQHYERLEFLGDAVLSLVVSQLLYARQGQASEGSLSRMRAHLVREESLHALALQLGLPRHLRLSEGEAKGGGAARASILADALEALIGAIHLDGGFEAAAQFVRRQFEPLMQDDADAERWAKDAKTALQEWLQARRHALPQYRIVATQGQAHAQVFEVEAAVAQLGLASTGRGASRRAAEQQAAAQLLARLNEGTP